MLVCDMQLMTRWFELCRRLAPTFRVPREQLEDAWAKLQTAYSQPPRKYHTLAHIAAGLSLFDEYRALAERPDQVEYAIWMHDVFYDPAGNENEEVSAAVAGMFGSQLGMSAEFLADVAKLILTTKHDRPPHSADAGLLADIDLSILGGAERDYAQYTRQLRWEYGFATDEQFRAGRGAFLRAMLARPAIFATPYLYQRFETAARRNMMQELERLANPLTD